MSNSAISDLSEWYSAHCDGEWEEARGIKIDTLDNPGWSLKVDLAGTSIAERAFAPVKLERSETDWIQARKNGQTLEAFGGPRNLEEMIQLFLAWAS
ncbi:immunity 53 family protein [Rhodomicrobium vannielii ATCC 17100]|uniref:immunity 53 family protein n=1 Tax=Rhodomicrobium vannielii TaxID=1069 RepID=UPI001918F275|nr:immunity 53 family protein [Rhodomicrobium vannielii]MBJ7535562.1 immunity 53 family protein [Rhodomicrobium vannielii ATCC 17100]